jgi:hypothetical protein
LLRCAKQSRRRRFIARRAIHVALAPYLPMNRAPHPPIEVPATRSNCSHSGLPVAASISSTTAIMLRPLMPPPSMHRILTGAAVIGGKAGERGCSTKARPCSSNAGVASLPPCARKSRPQPRLDSRLSPLTAVVRSGGAAAGAARVRALSRRWRIPMIRRPGVRVVHLWQHRIRFALSCVIRRLKLNLTLLRRRRATSDYGLAPEIVRWSVEVAT